MKKIYSLMLMLFLSVNIYAQWPANYGGVMLQAFYWDSFEETNWNNLKAQADELSKYFDLLWVPNSSNCVSANSMGYMPVYWFDQRSSFGGRERYLREMIAAYKERGTGIIEDVVINHKAPVGKDGSYIDFANEQWTWEGTTYDITWTGADICQNDDGGYIKSLGWDITGANDTGDDFSGARDLDHTSENVQKNCKIFLDYLLKDLGYVGFRLDMVKGYSAQFTKMYNESAKPEFCVGEYWDGQDAIVNWINGTGKTSAAFDFPFKYQMNKAFGNGDWSALDWKGIADSDYKRYAVTFIDNHDTYENESRLVGNVLGANAFMLAMPGTPCVFLKHWQRYPIAIGNMILARKAAGITNMSSITEQRGTGSGYVLKTQGTKGSVLLLCGNASYDTSGFTLITNSNNIRFYVSSNVTVEGLTPGSDDTEESDLTVYVEATAAPNLYAWAGTGTTLNGDWPGNKMTETETIGEKTFWKRTFSVAPINIIFNNGKSGDSNKTADITGLTHDSYFTYNGTSGYTDITDQYYTPEPTEMPACVKPIDGHLYVYFQANKDYDMPYIWVWGANEKNFCANTDWPGDKMKWVGTDSKNHQIWLWDKGETPETMPTSLLFSNKGTPKTADMKFQNGGYYDATGLIGVATQGIAPVTVSSQKTAPDYNLSGQRVDGNYRGIVIRNGRKVVIR